MASYHITVPRGKCIPQAYHKKAIELIWVIAGGGTARIGEKTIRLRRGDTLIIPPPIPHGFVGGKSGMTMLAMTSPRVDSQTDFYSCEEAHAAPKILSGRLLQGSLSRR